jgi:glycine cleavage system H protein
MHKPNPTDRKYTQDHEWALDNKDGTITMGITDYAQDQLTDIVFVELPETGRKVSRSDQIAVIESVKSVSDIYVPVSGTVLDVNKLLEDQPELINKDAFGEGWIVKLQMADPDEFNDLMDAEAYDDFLKSDAHS